MIPVFKHEIEAGLAEQIQADNTIAFVSSANKVNKQLAILPDLTKAIELSNSVASENFFDLFLFDSILVSTGWNNNDDVFLPAELWAAKSTPINKKINFMHEETDIIGHMVNCHAVDRSGKLIPFSTDLDEIPIAFDLVTAGILYKVWDNPDLQSRMDNLIAGILKGDWFVSMECLFPNFDYAIVTPTNEHKIIVRNEESSFLTKHLRRYGGKGEYEGHKIGRALRGICFSGKGIVDNPANPRSTIKNNNYSEQFLGAAASIDIFDKTENKMTAENTVSKAEYDALKAEFEKFKNEAKAANEKATAKEIENYQSKVSKLESDLAASKEVSIAHDNKVKALETEKAELNDKLVKANDELNKLNKEALKAKRLSLFADVDVTSEKAQKLVEQFIDSSDEMFSELVTAMPKKNKSENKCDEKMNEKSKADNLDSALDDAKNEVEKSSGSVISDETDKTKDTRAKAASWFGGMLKTVAKVSENNKGDK